MRNALNATDVSADVVDSAVLLVSELATNVILHARTELQVTIRYEDDVLSGDVRDWSTRRTYTGIPPADATTGRGLGLVDAVATRWGTNLEGEGKAVWFVVEPPSPGEQP